MAILRSGLTELEIRVLWAFEGGQAYALDMRWNSQSILNPEVVVHGGEIFAEAPRGWLVCRDSSEKPLTTPISAIKGLYPGESVRWRSDLYPALIVDVSRFDPGDDDGAPDGSIALNFGGTRFPGAVLSPPGVTSNSAHFIGALTILADVDAIARFGAEFWIEVDEFSRAGPG